MEDYIDHYFSASSWSDMNLIERSSWLHSAPNLQPPNHVGDSPASMIDSTLSLDGLAAEDATFHVPVGAAGSAINHGLISGEAGCYIDGSKGASNGNVMFTSMNLQSDNVTSKDFGDLALSHSFGETGYIDIADPKSCEFGGHLSEFETFSPLQQACLPFQSCDDIASLPCLIGQQFDENDGNINRYVDIDRIVKPEKLRTSVTEGNQELQNYILPSVAAEDRVTNEMIGLASHSQRDSPTQNSNSSGITKLRVRARRGQATDPHSIAERLRRERIAERMKNLQELVPNSRKTDKGSMLDEIIEYVKFLQMQVKVLSMSRSGAKGAVVPLITDGQAEVLNNSFPASADETAFEQEVLKLMESSVTKAMQYLQTKGLCLMPISLATAISKRNATTKSDGKIPEYVHNNSGSSSSDSNSSSDSLAAGVRTNHFFGEEITVVGGKIKREGSSSNGFDNIAEVEG